MMKRLKLQGDTPEAKLKHVETILTRLMRRSGDKVFFKSPPQMLYDYEEFPDSEGIVARGMIPIRGRVVKVCFGVAEILNKEKPVKVSVTLAGKKTKHTQILEIEDNLVVEEVDIPIEAGTMFWIKVERNDKDEYNGKGFWFSLLYDVLEEKAVKEEFLISQLEAISNERIQLSITEGDLGRPEEV